MLRSIWTVAETTCPHSANSEASQSLSTDQESWPTKTDLTCSPPLSAAAVEGAASPFASLTFLVGFGDVSGALRLPISGQL